MRPSPRSLVLALSLLAPLPALAQAGCIEITNVPFTITSSGAYCLTSSLSLNFTSTAIRVQADDVTVELGGYTLFLAAGANGVGAFGRSGITVRNGAIKGGAQGVSLSVTSEDERGGHLVEKLRIENSATVGIAVQGHGSTIRDNVVIGAGNVNGVSRGISASLGTGMVVSGNLVTNMAPRGPNDAVVGIDVVDAPGATVERNVVNNMTTPRGAGLYPTGISIQRSASFFTPIKAVVAGNRVYAMRRGIAAAGDTDTLLLDNAVGGSVTSFDGGTLAGTNNHSF
jgi:hypothetical protein